MCSREMAGKIVGLLFQDDPDHYDLVSKVGPGRVSKQIDYDINSFKATGKVDARTGRVKAGLASRAGGTISRMSRRRPRMSDDQVNTMLAAIAKTGESINSLARKITGRNDLVYALATDPSIRGPIAPWCLDLLLTYLGLQHVYFSDILEIGKSYTGKVR